MFSSIWKNNLIKYKCSVKDYSNKLDEISKNKFKNTFKFSNNGINKFILLLRKAVYPYDYLNEWENVNETTLPEKEKPEYSNLNMEKIIDADSMHGKEYVKNLKEKI